MWDSLPALTRQLSSLSSPSLQMLLTWQPGSFCNKVSHKIICSIFAAMGKHLVFPSSAGGGDRTRVKPAASQTWCCDWERPSLLSAGGRGNEDMTVPKQLMLSFLLGL